MFNFFNKNEKSPNVLHTLKNAAAKTKEAILGSVCGIIKKDEVIDEFALEDIESALIKADLGVDLAVEITEKIKKNKVAPDDIKNFLKSEFENILKNAGSNTLKYFEDRLNIYFITGVNGAGKTTLIGKLAYKMKMDGKKVLLAAGDTFRAAAEEQLEIWAKRAGVDVLGEKGIETAAVIYKGIEKAQNENYDVLIIDTAGRLQNKFNLIEELKKARAVIDKKAPNSNIESLLVLDANLGQNGLSQAKVFLEAAKLTGVAITKLDGSAGGGIIFAIAKEYGMPVKLVGVGEKIEDIQHFNQEEFIDAIF